MNFLKKHKYEVGLAAIIVLATVLRFYRLNYQSLWYDELYTMNEADPSLSWKTFFDFYLKDEHPPMFFAMERIMFTLFGYEDNVARILPAIAGVLNIYAIYLLGKEFLSKKLGLLAALLLTVNSYAIYFSQEARAYTFFSLFATLSLLFFLRVLKQRKTSDIVKHGVSTALMLYSHYFSLFAVFAQLVLVIIFWLNEQEHKRALFLAFFKSMLLALVLYVPCFPFLYATSKIEKYWTEPQPVTFVLNYYADFFGAYYLLYPLLLFLPVLYLYFVYRSWQENKSIRKNPVVLSAIVLMTTIILSFGIPYLRSVLVTPMFQNRYFFFTIPLFILIHAMAIVLIKNRVLSYSLFLLFALIQLYNVIIVQEYYSKVRKEDMRSLTTYIADNGKQYSIINEKSAWNQQYYLKKKGYTGNYVLGKMEVTLDSIVKGINKRPLTDTVWLEGGYTDHRAPEEVMKEFGTKYTKVSEQHFHDAWAELWVKKAL